MHVRVLTPDDLAAYRALHRFALIEAPHAFVATAENDAARPDEVVADLLARGEAWGAFEGERLVGQLVIDALPYPRLAHTRWLHAVYLHPDARGTGAGAALVQTAIDHAVANGARRIALWVNERNIAARRAYERLGFVETGRVPGGIRDAHDYVDDVLMCLKVGA
ncbi:GNAT family N-acetyltransferase [Terricaulis sp.]|uniref:GNAT family N-acetyltransferase n=1 Tax=Terricaulis sp. TaxID=2768686 RepID=UPI002AC58848|nr:GNAT family N-acetyltransferase [Terricaulis sp.]MDZ4692128.1 GNAT family N-acetyltransferase [Terricaulis sp.]